MNAKPDEDVKYSNRKKGFVKGRKCYPEDEEND